MQFGKGTQAFNTYAANLQRALVVGSIGSQLSVADDVPRIRGVMIHNPYHVTVADLGICKFRIGPAA